MDKYFVTKGQIGYVVVCEMFDKSNGGSHYVSVSEEFNTEKSAQKLADKMNEISN